MLPQSVFLPLAGVLPQLCSFSGVGPTVYALIVHQGAAAGLYGPAISACGLAGWPAAAKAPADTLLRGARVQGEIVVFALCDDGATRHCVAVHIPPDETDCEPGTPDACAASVLDA